MSTPPTPPSDATALPITCQRRWDVSIIAALLAASGITEFASAFGMSSLQAFLMPRFGWSGLTLCLFPVIFLGFYLWKPAPRLLWQAAAMTTFVAFINGLMIFQTGTVGSVANVFHDRLHSSYFYAVVSLILIALYLSAVAWRTRSHVLGSAVRVES